MDNLVRLARFTLLPLPVIAALILQAQIGMPKDPGPRQGAPGEGAMIIGLTGAERELFRKGLGAFETVSSVQGDGFVPQTEVGLGPTFNLDSCAGCHAYPNSGGT